MFFSLIKKICRGFLEIRQRNRVYSNLDIGSGSHVDRRNLDGMFPQLIHIGENCIFAPHSIVLSHDASYAMFTGKYHIAPVTIGDRVFVGYGSVIMPGITIGDNVVIGALSIVTKNVPSNSVVAGVPARVICNIDEYLAKVKQEELFEPDYDYAATGAIRPKQTLAFQVKVYNQLGIDRRNK
jgi:maltose O-acetyltransferase